ncbi:MAG: hypothetical protein MZW92_72565 [Comamonadaceae bacterium]|nr:hypothetical protein [Comamonadaceae bacterium]
MSAVATGRGGGLVVSVDCGIKSVGFVRAARSAGIDVIITDHHLPGTRASRRPWPCSIR